MTIGGKIPEAEIVLQSPNLVMRKLYAERILKMTFRTANELDEGREVARLLFAQGNIEPLCAFVERHLLAVYDNRDYKGYFENARQQLQSYRQTLTQKYGGILKLRTYAVVAVSLERVLREEVS